MIHEHFKIYYVDNSDNDKVYVGQTRRSLQRRLRDHKYGARTKANRSYFYKSMQSHGSHKFHIHELGTYSSSEEMNRAEQLWIVLLRSHDPEFGYNGTFGGDRNWGITEATRSKLRESHLGHEGPLKGQKRPDWVVEKLKGPRPKWRGENAGTFRKDVSTDEIIAYRMQGLKNELISEKTGLTPSGIHHRIKLWEKETGNKVPSLLKLRPVRSGNKSHGFKHNITKSDINQLRESGLTVKEISTELGCSYGTVRNRLSTSDKQEIL